MASRSSRSFEMKATLDAAGALRRHHLGGNRRGQAASEIARSERGRSSLPWKRAAVCRPKQSAKLITERQYREATIVVTRGS